MKIERIHIEAFGRLSDFDTGGNRLGDLVVVLGPNEAGKSTLFNFLTTALYGFHPASRERNPHLPWGSEEAAGRIQASLEGDRCVEVERRLRSSPSGRLTSDGSTEELRNQPLPWVEHVPRSVFRQVFAVTLADLAGLDEETWARIQDRIIGSMGSADLMPARGVAETLEREASEIWRPNRRGNQRLRSLQDEIRALRSRRLGALERDRDIRSLVEERENGLVRLREVRAERQTHRVAVERVTSLLPLRRQRTRIESLLEQGGPRDELRGLPADPATTLAGLHDDHQRLTLRVRTLSDELEEPEAILARYDEATRDLLDRADDVTRFLTLATEVAPDRRRTREVEDELDGLRRRLEATATEILADPWNDGLEAATAAISLALLRDRVAKCEQSATPTEPAAVAPSPGAPSAHSNVDDGESRRDRGPIGAAGTGLAAGAALLAWGLSAESAAAVVAGTAALTVGGVALWSWIRRAPEPADVVAEPEVDPAPARAKAEVEAMLDGLPVRPELLASPGHPLVEGVARLQEIVRRARELAATMARSLERLRDADEEALRLARALGLAGTPGAEELAPLVDRRLADARRIRDAAQSAERDHRRISRERATVQKELELIDERSTTLERALAPLGDGDPRRGAETAKVRIEAHRRADQLADELERTHPDLAARLAQIDASERAGEAWVVDEGDLARRRAYIEELDGEVERLIAETEALEGNAEHLRELETVDAVDGEIAALREKEVGLIRERDRAWVLAQLVRDADRRFRDEHQPDLIRRAGNHLGRLTGGRYDRLLVDEARDDGLFHLMGPSLPAPVPLTPPVSSGTLEQAYLSLRLAIVDHLDQGGERLPLFIDEAFVNWDRARRERGLDVLAELSADRQIFVFTCHPSMAQELASRGGCLLRLERDG